MKSESIFTLMCRAEPIPDFNFFKDKEIFFDNWLKIYKSGERFYVVCEIPYHAVDIRYIEIMEADAIMIQRNCDEASAILSKNVDAK